MRLFPPLPLEALSLLVCWIKVGMVCLARPSFDEKCLDSEGGFLGAFRFPFKLEPLLLAVGSG